MHVQLSCNVASDRNCDANTVFYMYALGWEVTPSLHMTVTWSAGPTPVHWLYDNDYMMHSIWVRCGVGRAWLFFAVFFNVCFVLTGGGFWGHCDGVQGGRAASWHLSEHGGAGQPAAELQERWRFWGFLQLCEGKGLVAEVVSRGVREQAVCDPTLPPVLQPIQLISSNIEVAKAGKVPPGKTEIPFEFPLNTKSNKVLYETYHGVFVNIQVSDRNFQDCKVLGLCGSWVVGY